ncbi:MAG: serine hydrolase [Saprospiraceae bacterium]|nr:serine hydrolase [Saprospiraceae bacterium]
MILVYLVLLILISCGEGQTSQLMDRTSSHLSEAIDSILHTAVTDHVIPGAVVLISRDDQIIHHRAYGFAQRYKYGMIPLDQPIQLTTLHRFDLASLTKVFATTFALMILTDQQEVLLDEPAYRYLPDFRGISKDSITVRHLLTHSAGLSPWKPTYYHASSPDEAYQYIRQLPLAYPVGKERHYSDLGFMLLGYLIESVTGKPLDTYLSEALFDPLGMKHTTFNPSPDGLPFAVTSHGNPFEKLMVDDDDFGYLCDEDPQAFTGWRNYVLTGEVNDGNAYHAHQGVAGHAGLFSIAAELQVLLQILLDGGVYSGHRFVSAEVIEKFLTKDALGHGLGWAMSQDVLPVDNLPAGSFGHTGFTGTYVLGIPSLDLSIILLTNRQNLGTNQAGYYNSVTPLRKGLTELVLEDR